MLKLLFSLALSALAAGRETVLERMKSISNDQAPPICAEIRSQMAELAKLTPLYEDPRRSRSILLPREKIASEILRLVAEFDPLDKEFHRGEQELRTELAIRTLSKAEIAPPGTRSHLVQYYVYHEALSASKRCVQECHRKLLADDDLLQAAMQRHARRSFRIRIFAIVAAVLLALSAGSVFLARRMAARTVRQTLVQNPAPAEPASQALAGNIRLDKVIGEGGMGVVHEGTDLTLDRKVAVKQMRDEISEHPRALSQFLAEARLVAALKHPNIVEIYSILKERGKLYLVFEYVDGETLDHALRVNKKLTLPQSLSVLRQAASALDYAHSKKVIHRDLKPSNIMLTPAGVARLMDFGIAYQAKKTIAMLTKAEKWGTPAFMSPEQELGEIGRETDIYALGACFYAMLTGTLPFPGPDHLAQKRAMKPAGAEHLPAKLLPVMKKVFAVDPRQRYHSGAELVSAVSAIEGLPS
ncbi:MAG: serine/threonine-protein kinase [Elusimicrobiota bacterium]